MKIIHPTIKDQISSDIRIMMLVAIIIEDYIVCTRNWSLQESVAEFSNSMHSQLNMIVEAQRLDRFCENFKEKEGIVFPRPVWPYVTKGKYLDSVC